MGAWSEGIWGGDTPLDAKHAFYLGNFGDCSNTTELLENVRDRFGSEGVLSVTKIFVEANDAHRLKDDATEIVEEAVENEMDKLECWVESDKRRTVLREFTQQFNEGLGEGESISPVREDALLS